MGKIIGLDLFVFLVFCAAVAAFFAFLLWKPKKKKK
jgi:hypothetical protein